MEQRAKKMKISNKIMFISLFAAVIGLIIILSIAFARSSSAVDNAISVTNTINPIRKLAPGEMLPVSVNLSNFGGGDRVDVIIKYSILTNTNVEVYTTSDTVAVETTANFVKNVFVPSEIASGTYIAKTSIIYQGQITPALSQFSFIVENKILGIFQSDFIFYSSVSVLIGVLLVLFGRFLFNRFRVSRFAPLDYRNIPVNDRIYYEILSDTIMQMRGHVGDRALLIAAGISGFNIEPQSGRVLGFTEDPSKVIANLVSEYEKQLGKKVSFSLRKEE